MTAFIATVGILSAPHLMKGLVLRQPPPTPTESV